MGIDLGDLHRLLRNVRETLASRKYFRHTPQPWWFPMERHILGAMLTSDSLRGVLVWGAGGRLACSSYERETLDFVASALNLVAAASDRPVSLKLILADSHAEANGYRRQAVRCYLEDVEVEATARGVGVIWLSDVLRELGFQSNEISFPPSSILEATWNALPESIHERLVRDAGRVVEGADPVAAAHRYAGAAGLEAALFTRFFSDSFLVSFSPPDLAALLPSLPTLFMFTNERRETARPWFR